VLLSFARFEREVTGERIRDKIAASKRGMWMGGMVPLGYDVRERRLAINAAEARLVRQLYQRYLELGSVRLLKQDLDRREVTSKVRRSSRWRAVGQVIQQAQQCDRSTLRFWFCCFARSDHAGYIGRWARCRA
jgi:DNA invertase Pin-like site-specific DNA recombinase